MITHTYKSVLIFIKMASAEHNLSNLKGILRDLLECPICFGTIKSVFQCQNGHITGCKDCISKLDKCSICGYTLNKIRNLQIEKAVDILGG